MVTLTPPGCRGRPSSISSSEGQFLTKIAKSFVVKNFIVGVQKKAYIIINNGT